MNESAEQPSVKLTVNLLYAGTTLSRTSLKALNWNSNISPFSFKSIYIYVDLHTHQDSLSKNILCLLGEKNKWIKNRFEIWISILCFRRRPQQSLRSTVKACNKEAEPNFYGKLYLWRHIKTIILQVVKMNQ